MAMTLKGVKNFSKRILELKALGEELQENLQEKIAWWEEKSEKWQESDKGQEWQEYFNQIEEMISRVEDLEELEQE